MVLLSSLNGDLDYLGFAPMCFLRIAVNCSRFSFHMGLGPRSQLASLTSKWARVLWLAAVPVGLVRYALDIQRERPKAGRKRA